MISILKKALYEDGMLSNLLRVRPGIEILYTPGGVSYGFLRCKIATPKYFPHLSCCKIDPRQIPKSRTDPKKVLERVGISNL